MGKDKQVWSESTTKLLVGVVTDAIKPKVNLFIRGLIKPAVKIGVEMSNKYLAKVIPDSVDGYVNDAIIKANDGDWDSAAEYIGLAGDELVDIPGVDDDHEKQLFVSIAKAIVNGVKSWIENKKGK